MSGGWYSRISRTEESTFQDLKHYFGRVVCVYAHPLPLDNVWVRSFTIDIAGVMFTGAVVFCSPRNTRPAASEHHASQPPHGTLPIWWSFIYLFYTFFCRGAYVHACTFAQNTSFYRVSSVLLAESVTVG